MKKTLATMSLIATCALLLAVASILSGSSSLAAGETFDVGNPDASIKIPDLEAKYPDYKSKRECGLYLDTMSISRNAQGESGPMVDAERFGIYTGAESAANMDDNSYYLFEKLQKVAVGSYLEVKVIRLNGENCAYRTAGMGDANTARGLQYISDDGKEWYGYLAGYKIRDVFSYAVSKLTIDNNGVVTRVASWGLPAGSALQVIKDKGYKIANFDTPPDKPNPPESGQLFTLDTSKSTFTFVNEATIEATIIGTIKPGTPASKAYNAKHTFYDVNMDNDYLYQLQGSCGAKGDNDIDIKGKRGEWGYKTSVPGIINNLSLPIGDGDACVPVIADKATSIMIQNPEHEKGLRKAFVKFAYYSNGSIRPISKSEGLNYYGKNEGDDGEREITIDANSEFKKFTSGEKVRYIYKPDTGAVISAENDGFPCGSAFIVPARDSSALGVFFVQGRTGDDVCHSRTNDYVLTNTISYWAIADKPPEGLDEDNVPKPPDGGNNGPTKKKASCYQGSNTAIAWILCPVLTIADETTQKVAEAIDGLLFVNESQFDTSAASGENVYNSWNVLRQISTVIIIIIALVMIFSEAMGAGIMDNYSVKKLLPRLLFTGIGIQLSWVLLTTLVQIFNSLGVGIAGLMLWPFNVGGEPLTVTTNLRDILPLLDATKDLFTSGPAGEFREQGLLFVGMAAGAYFAFGALFAAGIAVLAAIVIGFFTVILRNIIIYLAIILAPVAMAMSVLPGTQKLSKLWWESFEKALAMYPIIMALLAAGKITSVLILQGNDMGGLAVIAGIVAWYAPFFFLPATLKLGGTALSKVAGFAGDKSKGFFDKAKQANENRKKFRGAASERRAFRGDRSWWEKGKYNPLVGVGASQRAFRRAGAHARQGGFGISKDDRAIRSKVKGSAVAGFEKEQMENAALALNSTRLDTLDNREKIGALSSIMKARLGSSVDVNGTKVRVDEFMKRQAASTMGNIPGSARDFKSSLEEIGGDNSKGGVTLRNQILSDNVLEFKDKFKTLYGGDAWDGTDAHAKTKRISDTKKAVVNVTGGLNTVDGAKMKDLDGGEVEQWAKEFQLAKDAHRDAVARGVNVEGTRNELQKFLDQINANGTFAAQGLMGDKAAKMQTFVDASGTVRSHSDIQAVFGSDGKKCSVIDGAGNVQVEEVVQKVRI